MGFKIERNFLFLPLVGQDRPNEQDEAIWWDAVVQLQPLLGTGDRSQYGQSVNTGLDVGRSTVFLRQHSGDTGDLILGIKGGSISCRWLGGTLI
jgi:hypothetical protein